jgi:hypothetical protein
MGLVRLFRSKEIAPQSELEPSSVTARKPLPAPTSTLEATPASAPSSTPQSIYVVRDAAGTIVDLSYCEKEPASPELHAQDFLYWLVNNEATAGGYVLEKVLKWLYATAFCRWENIKPMPWPGVLRKFTKLIGGPKTYKSVHKGGRRRRLRAYRIPSPQDLALITEQQSEAVA